MDLTTIPISAPTFQHQSPWSSAAKLNTNSNGDKASNGGKQWFNSVLLERKEIDDSLIFPQQGHFPTLTALKRKKSPSQSRHSCIARQILKPTTSVGSSLQTLLALRKLSLDSVMPKIPTVVSRKAKATRWN